MALKKLCPKCNKIIDAGQAYCKECTEKRLSDRTNNNRYYDKNYRDKEGIKFYNSDAWILVTAKVKSRDLGLCKLCKSENTIRSVEMVHHIVERKENSSKELDPNNCISLCNGCHRHVHHEYNKNEYAKQIMQSKLRDLLG
jgi:5-methylcytosine-specific restriction endonuclease McrA